MVKDPSCGMNVNPITAKFSSIKGGEKFYFCSKDCKDKFDGIKSVSKSIIPIEGMRCASCVAKIEGALGKVPGVRKAVVNFAAKKAFVDFDSNLASEDMLKDAIKSSGYETETDVSGKVVLDVGGMESQHCVGIVERALKGMTGVSNVNVNLATKRAVVFFDPLKSNPDLLISAVKKAGYDAFVSDSEKAERDEETAYWLKRFVVSAVFGVPLLYLAMGHMIGLPLPMLAPMTVAIFQFILATPIIIAGGNFYTRGFRALLNRNPNMDSLVAVGTGAAYAYSLFVSIMLLFGFNGYSIEMLYFEIAGLIVAFIILGKLLESIAKGRTSAAIKKLLGLQPNTATVIRNRQEITVDISDVKVGDIVVVKPGERIPVDGIVVDGRSSVDESMISGESIPVEKFAKSKVIGGTINKTGSFTFKATQVGKDTVLANIIRMVEEAQGSKAPIQQLADKISFYFVPVVIVIALLSLVIWYLLGNFGFGLLTFIAVLVIACPCALGLATPTAIMVGTGKAAEYGILFKNAESLQKMRDVNLVVFDKTGTLTVGRPEVTDIVPVGRGDEEAVLQLAAIVEKRSEHPLAEAVLSAAKNRKIVVASPSDFEAVSGKGIIAKYKNKTLLLGNHVLMRDKKIDVSVVDSKVQSLENEGKTVMFLSTAKQLIGIIAVADQIKPFAREAVAELHRLGKEVMLITGDNERVAHAIASQAGIKEVLADVLPGDKANKIKELQLKGFKVAMVGDGINDAPALSQADVGIAIGSGTDIAIESGSVVLIKNDLRDVVTAMSLSRYTMLKIRQNLFWAFAYNVVLIPVAAGVLYPLTGWLLSPVLAGAAMAFSSVSVVSNSLLMNTYKPKLKNQLPMP